MPWDESRVAGLCLISPSKKSFFSRPRVEGEAGPKSQLEKPWLGFFLARMFVFRICFQPICPVRNPKTKAI